MIKTISTPRTQGAATVCECDICGKNIVDARQAIAFYGGAEFPGDTIPVKHVHKGECDQRAKEQYGDRGCDELTTYLIGLLINVGVRRDNVVGHFEIAEMMASI